MNVHKRCKENVANTCGINPRHMADLLQEMVSFNYIQKKSERQTSEWTNPGVSKIFSLFLFLHRLDNYMNIHLSLRHF